MSKKKTTRNKRIKKNSDYKDDLEYLDEQETADQRRIADAVEKFRQPNILEDFETELSSNEPIKELFTGKNIKFKAQLSEEQRNAVIILYTTYYTLLNDYNVDVHSLKDLLSDYVEFSVSLDRKGRSEYVDAHKSLMQQQQQAMMNPNNIGQQMQGFKSQ